MNFRRWVVFTFLIHVLVVCVDKGGGLVLYLLTANQPPQHGMSGIAASVPFIMMAIANLGLATSLVYFLRRGLYTAQQAFQTTVTVALVWGGLIALLAFLAIVWVLPALNPHWNFSPWLVLPWCIVVPLLLIASYGNSVQLAVERVRDYGVVHLTTSVAFLPAFFVVFLWLGHDVASGDVPMAVAWGRLISTAVVAALVLWLVRKVVRLRLGIDRGFLLDGLRYGWKANLTSTLTYLNHRIDLVVLGALFVPTLRMAHEVLGPGDPLRDSLAAWSDGVNPVPGVVRDDLARDKMLLEAAVWVQVGFYSMAVTWAELVWHFPEAMRDLFFSKVAGSSHEEARQLTPVLSRLGLAISMVAGGLILLLIDPVMGAITWLANKEGDPWHTTWSAPVGQALVLLTPGTVAFTVSKVLQADLAARNQLNVCVTAQLLVLVTMLTLDWVWMPTYGAAGAALASTVAYVLSTLYTLWAYSRSTGTPSWTCLVVHWSDFHYIRDICNGVLAKIRGKRA